MFHIDIHASITAKQNNYFAKGQHRIVQDRINMARLCQRLKNKGIRQYKLRHASNSKTSSTHSDQQRMISHPLPAEPLASETLMAALCKCFKILLPIARQRNCLASYAHFSDKRFSLMYDALTKDLPSHAYAISS